ncbi:MAG: hypothetical protein HN712_08325 [Gemmatimonadetes bacterium]|jgi:phosphoglycerate dehydrogenase-like enzyme|nr:hypothetical protein [Gemmatimonadota bacterium]MBT6144588.1 hypothetical protein [Gemmatimonadota bacterium]MBT7860304.1 hypothetical protein [Gemmatimonadota bacterium]
MKHGRILVDVPQWDLEADWERLRQMGDPVRIEADVDAESLTSGLAGVTGIIRLGQHLPELDASVLAAADDLEIVGVRSDRFGRGIDLDVAHQRGICVIDTDNIASAHPVAEWDLALMLLCLRNAGAVYRQMMASTERWAHAGNEAFTHGELTGKAVGLIGCGHVGQRLIELLAPFHTRLRVFDPYLDAAIADRLQLQRVDTLEALLDHADILVVQVPHTPRTEGLIGAAELERLGEGKILVNCSRGKVIDQVALIERLKTGRLIAGLDVFDPEPLPADSELRSMPNVFCTPHIAWYAPHAFHRYFASMVDEFVRHAGGEPLRFELTQRMVDIRHGRL